MVKLSTNLIIISRQSTKFIPLIQTLAIEEKLSSLLRLQTTEASIPVITKDFAPDVLSSKLKS
jgi:hypothetical protein